jgi:hypothetical protein
MLFLFAKVHPPLPSGRERECPDEHTRPNHGQCLPSFCKKQHTGQRTHFDHLRNVGRLVEALDPTQSKSEDAGL